jgi:hypothetical protein
MASLQASGSTPLSSPLLTVVSPTASKSRWFKALDSLNENDKLQLHLDTEPKDYLQILKDVQDIANKKRQLCLEKGWKFKRRDGKVVIIRDLFEKIIIWIQRFKEIGDIAVNYDPGHAALPWAAIRFLLSIAIEDAQIFGAMVEGIAHVTMLITRCEIFEKLYLKPASSRETGLEQALVGLYAAILRFQSNTIRFYGRNTRSKMP